MAAKKTSDNDSTIQALIDLRKKLKAKKPKFLRQEATRKKRLSNKWRKPKGIDSKMRLKLKGYRKLVSKGYKSPASVRGFLENGKKPVLVSTIAELGSVDKNAYSVVLSSKLGLKKRLELIKKALALGLDIYNYADVEAYLKKKENELNAKKERKKSKESSKELRKKELEKKAREKEKAEDNKEDSKEGSKKAKASSSLEDLAEQEASKKEPDDKLKEEKYEKDKILTKKSG